MDYEQLNEARSQAAQAEFETFEFDCDVQESGGWEFSQPGREWIRSVFVEDPENPEGDTATISFHIVFAADDSAEIEEAYALTVSGGNFVGRRAEPASPAP